jgi:hypothetical protein
MAPVAVAAIIPARVEANPVDDMCEYYAECLAVEMKKRHGGQWKVEINHDKKSIFGRGVTQSSS